MSTDGEIIRRSQESPAAFAELYDRHARVIHRYAARRVPDAADDIMSETFLVAFERRASFAEGNAGALPWLYGIATVLLDKHRRQEARAWRGLLADANAGLSQGSDEPDDRLDASREIVKLAATLRRMKPADRDAILLYAWSDLGYVGVALALDIPVGTVRSRLNRARRQLRHTIGMGNHAEEVDHGRDDPAPQRA